MFRFRLSPVRLLLAALPIVLISSCGTPQQWCINAATKDLRNVEKLIEVTQGNIDRGYAYATSVRTVPQWVDCTPDATKANPHPETDMCLVQTAQTFRVPVAIDLDAEQRKLKQLRAKRKVLASQVQSAVAACEAQYPESTGPFSAAPPAVEHSPG